MLKYSLKINCCKTISNFMLYFYVVKDTRFIIILFIFIYTKRVEQISL